MSRHSVQCYCYFLVTINHWILAFTPAHLRTPSHGSSIRDPKAYTIWLFPKPSSLSHPIMSTVWYCCQCKNGPMGTNNNSSCSQYNCQHLRCSYCDVVQQEYFALNEHEDATQSHSTALLGHDIVLGSSGSLVSLGHTGHAYTCSEHGYGEPTDAGDHRWTCSECYADNNYHTDAGCWSCQHWRCGSCQVYEVIRK